MIQGTSSKQVRDIATLLAEAWDRFHPEILWWSTRDYATCPDHAAEVYRALLSGPKAGMPLASELHAAIHRQADREAER